MKRFIKELKENRLIIIIILLTIILTSLFNTYLKKDYSRVNNETTDFVSAKVTEVTSSEVEYDNNLDSINYFKYSPYGDEIISLIELQKDANKKYYENCYTI